MNRRADDVLELEEDILSDPYYEPEWGAPRDRYTLYTN